MILNEILDRKIADFKVTAEEHNVLEIEAKIGKRNIRFYSDMANEFKKSIVDVEFSEEYQEPSRKMTSYTYKLTGSGNEFAVLSFIKQCMEMMIKKWSPDVVRFTADKNQGESRSKIYEKLLKRELKDYTIEIDDSRPLVRFTLRKKHENI